MFHKKLHPFPLREAEVLARTSRQRYNADKGVIEYDNIDAPEITSSDLPRLDEYVLSDLIKAGVPLRFVNPSIDGGVTAENADSLAQDLMQSNESQS